MQQIVEEIQVKLSVIGHQQWPLGPLQQTAEALRRRTVIHAFPVQLLVRNAGKLRNEGRQHLSCRKADKGIEIPPLRAVFQGHGTDLNDPVPAELNSGSFRIEHHQPVKILPKFHYASQFSPVA